MKQAADTTTIGITTTKTADQQAAEIGMGVIVAVIALSGIWGAVCLLSALAQYGIVPMAEGWLQAVCGNSTCLINALSVPLFCVGRVLP
jgi:hypothetical protein